jgi:hypothetical protein
VIDQSNSFDEERYQRARDRYFIPYLLALLERAVLTRIRATVSEAFGSGHPGGEVAADVVRRSYEDLLEFNARLYVSDLSSRDQVNRAASICARGLQVEDEFMRANRMLSAIEAGLRNQQLVQMLASSRDLQKHSNEISQKVELAEVFILSFYGLYCAKTLGDFLKFYGPVAAVGALGVMLVAGVLAYRAFRPEVRLAVDRPRRLLVALAAAILVYFGLALGLGKYGETGGVQAAPSAQPGPPAVAPSVPQGGGGAAPPGDRSAGP